MFVYEDRMNDKLCVAFNSNKPKENPDVVLWCDENGVAHIKLSESVIPEIETE